MSVSVLNVFDWHTAFVRTPIGMTSISVNGVDIPRPPGFAKHHNNSTVLLLVLSIVTVGRNIIQKSRRAETHQFHEMELNISSPFPYGNGNDNSNRDGDADW